MRKIFVLMLTISVLLFSSCSGCNSATYFFNNEELSSEIEKIEIVRVYNLFPEVSFDLICVLDAEENNELLSELSNIEFRKYFGPPLKVRDLCIKFTFVNQRLGFLSSDTYWIYSNDYREVISNMNLGCSESEFEQLLSKFMRAEI